MKRRTIYGLVMVAALLAAAPGWAAPSARVSSPVNQVLDWLGQVWRVIWAETGGCVDPNGRPAPCLGAAPSGDYTPGPNGDRSQ